MYPERSVRHLPGSYRGCGRWSWRVPDRATDILLTGLPCLVAGMEPVRSLSNSEDRDFTTGLVFVSTGHRKPLTTGRRATIPNPDREPAGPIPRHQFGVISAPEVESTRSATTTISGHPDRINHSATTQVRIVSTDRLVRHTHLQRVASCIQVDGGGGGGCVEFG